MSAASSKPRAVGVVLQDSRVALLRRHKEGRTYHVFPGGKIKAGEKPKHAALREVLEELTPDVVAIEQLFSHVRNPKTAILMAHVRGAILLTLAERELPVVHYTPTQVKRLLTGSGQAPKEQIQHAVKAELKLDRIPEPNDVADASAIALCLYHSVRFAA